MRKISCAQSWLQVLWARSQCVFAVFSLLSVFSQHRQSQPVNREKSRDQMHRVWSLLLTWHWNRGGVNPSRLCTGPGFLSGWTLTDDACSARRIAHKTGNDLLTAVERRVPSPRSQPAQADRDTRLDLECAEDTKLFKDSSPGSLRTTFTRKLSTQGAAVRMATFPTPTGVIISRVPTAEMDGAVRSALRWDAARTGTLGISLERPFAPSAKMSLDHLSWRAFQILFATVTTVLTQG